MKNHKVKILFISLYTEMGGGEYVLFYLMRYLDRNRFQPVLMCDKRGPLTERSETTGVEIAIVPFEVVILKHLIKPAAFLKNVRASLAIKRVIRERNIDIIQCTDVLSLLLLLPSKIGDRIPIVYGVTFFHEWSRSVLFNFLAVLMVNRITTISRAHQNDLVKKTIGLKKRCRLIYSGVDTERFFPRPAEEKRRLRTTLGLPQEKKIIGFVGRFEPRKGHLTFLSAARQILQSRNDLVFLIVGGAMTEDIIPQIARYKKRVEKEIGQFSSRESLIVWGHRDDVPEIMSSLDVYVCPSDDEPFGLVVLEAFACGLPVVASRTVGALEVVGESDRVFVAEPETPESFVQKILEALKYNAEQAPPSSGSEPVITWNECARNHEQLYEELLP
ncbi:MAG TPA: glycosyltransferase family 4 protein [Bacteroidota bacterium]|jgi:glycosyltransferase involved in cell wall biosynthesis|nr:glycosyltransferase family 4 protein [Bacteroidota bacterium]